MALSYLILQLAQTAPTCAYDELHPSVIIIVTSIFLERHARIKSVTFRSATMCLAQRGIMMTSFLVSYTVGIHPPKLMMHMSPLFSQNLLIPYFRSIYVFCLMYVFLLPPILAM